MICLVTMSPMVLTHGIWKYFWHTLCPCIRLQSKTQCANDGKILIAATKDDVVFNQNTGMSEILKKYLRTSWNTGNWSGGEEMITNFDIPTAIWYFKISYLGQMKFMFNDCQFHIQLTIVYFSICTNKYCFFSYCWWFKFS